MVEEWPDAIACPMAAPDTEQNLIEGLTCNSDYLHKGDRSACPVLDFGHFPAAQQRKSLKGNW